MLPLNSAYGKSLLVPARRAKIDYTHPAAQNLRFAGVASSGNFINLFQGSRGTVGGAPTSAVTSVIGQATSYVGGTDVSTFAGQFSSTDNNATIAAIFMITGATGFRTIFLNNVGNTGWLMSVFNTTNFLNFGLQGATTIGNTAIAINVPYFAAGSANPTFSGPNSGLVVKRLDTGVITTLTSNGIAANAAGSTYSVGNDTTNSRPLQGNLAAVMFSGTFLNLQQLIKWADDPWGFWYATEFGPENFTFPVAPGIPNVGPAAVLMGAICM